MLPRIIAPFLLFALLSLPALALPTVSILKYKKASDPDYTSAARAAIAYLKGQGGGILTYPAGQFTQGPIEISGSSITIKGAGLGKTLIIRNSERGYAFYANKQKSVSIQDLTIDCDKSPIEGGVYYGGCTACGAVRVAVKNGDASSFAAENLLFNGNGAQSPSDRNSFRYCQASGQKRYHEVGGKSPFLSGTYATNTVFDHCTVVDCLADAYDSDNAPGTVFSYCVARNTKGMSAFAGFWSEGEQTDSDHRVKWQHCQVTGFKIGFGVAERVKATIIDGQATNCMNAVKGLNNQFRVTINKLTAKACGQGLENTDIDGAIAFAGPATLNNVVTTGTIAKNAFCNYGGNANPDQETIIGPGCVFDKDVMVSYENSGSHRITLNGATLKGGNLRYYNSIQAELLVKNTKFINSGIVGARIKQSRITAGSRFVTTDSTRTAIQLGLDSFNTTVDNATFEGFRKVTDNGQVGKGVTQSRSIRGPLPR